MNDSPWPQHGASRVLYLLDAAHRLERELLEQWLKEQTVSTGDAVDSVSVALPIAMSRTRIPTSALRPHMDRPADTLVIPLRVVWLSSLEDKGHGPRLRDLWRGNAARPRPWWARYILTKHPERIHRIAAEPATLGELRERLSARQGDPADAALFAEFVAGQAGLALDLAERRLRGSRYKIPRQVAANLLASPQFNLALDLLAADSGRPLEELRAESAKIMKELISTPNAFWIDVMGALTRKVRTLGYKADVVIDREQLDRIRQISREYPCVFLFTHKTHVDAFAHMSVLYEHDFPAPHTLGGINMAFAGLGYTLRHSGAIFIRRTFAENTLYKLILRQYIGYLMEKRFSLSWAFEGTRSRVGKLMPPRYGLLKYVIEAAHAAQTRNLHIIPVAINYDLIGDVKDYANEETGATKRPESLGWFMGYLRGLRQPMGQIYLDYGDPLVLDEVPSPDDRMALSKLAFQVGVEANRLAPITPPSLLSLILLGASPGALTRSELVAQVEAFTAWARERGIRMTDHFDAANRQPLIDLFWLIVDHGLITAYRDGPEDLYAIAPEKHTVASYYRNTTVHYFVNKAIAELALLRAASASDQPLAAFWSEAENLRDLFKFEFFYAPSDEFRQQVVQELDRYQPEWQAQLEQDASTAKRLLSHMTPHVAHSALLPFVEAYRVVADILARLDDQAALEEKECISQALTYGRQAYLQRRISSEASIGKLLFQNGYRLMANLGLTEAGDGDLRARRIRQARALRELALRLERIRSLAQPI